MMIVQASVVGGRCRSVSTWTSGLEIPSGGIERYSFAGISEGVSIESQAQGMLILRC